MHTVMTFYPIIVVTLAMLITFVILAIIIERIKKGK